MNTTRDPRLPNPMHHAREVTQIEYDGHPFKVGQRIAFDVRVYEPKKDRTHDERQEAVIVELASRSTLSDDANVMDEVAELRVEPFTTLRSLGRDGEEVVFRAMAATLVTLE